MKDWETFRAWLFSIREDHRTLLQRIAIKELSADLPEEIGSSDISCRLFSYYEEFSLGTQTIYQFIVDKVCEIETTQTIYQFIVDKVCEIETTQTITK